jgi:STE24 endopeptidase
VSGRADEYFSAEQIEKARRYNRPGYAAWGLNTAIALAVLSLLVEWGPAFASWPWWLAALASTALVLTLPWLARLPVGYVAGYVRERHWGFSTQTPAAWLADRAKGLGVGLVLAAGAMVGFLGLARLVPDWWPLVAVLGAAVFVFVLSYLAPVVIEPIFNRFSPIDDEVLADDLHALAERAGVPVRDVLVADASRRTTKVNAYVSGVGKTRRVVVFDTLIRESSPAEIQLVVAHELGHRKGRHVLQGTVLATFGMAVAVLVVWAVVGRPEPADVPTIVLLVAALELLVAPVLAVVSRRWERDADLFSLELTRDAGVFESTFRNLAVANLADLDPPRAFYYALFTHPTIPQRIASGRRWAERYRSTA